MFENENLAPLCQRCHRAQHPVVLRGAMATTRAREWRALITTGGERQL